MASSVNLNRRSFLVTGCMGMASLLLCKDRTITLPGIEEFIAAAMESNHIPGVAACIVDHNRIVWSKGYGQANIEKEIPMTPDSIQNIASISKTVTATAVMQLWERGAFRLDDDINEYLSFSARNPFYPSVPITFRHLLTHTSSIKDGRAYYDSYSCGDPRISLKNWIEGYLSEDGLYYNKEDNYSKEQPGRKREYSNIGFGLLGLLVEEISGESFADYCKKHMFSPLGMNESSWYLSDLDLSKHVTPYSYIRKGEGLPRLLPEDYVKDTAPDEGLVPHCLYSFPNIPDGLLRTSVNQLARYLMAYINNGAYNSVRILKESTVKKILTPQNDRSMPADGLETQGLAWSAQRSDSGSLIWGHGGGDPGVSTKMSFDMHSGIGVVVFANAGAGRVGRISDRLYKSVIHS